MKKLIFVLLALLLLLVSGCAAEPEMVLEDRSESKTWDSMPAFTYGRLETEKLEVVPWYDGRMEAVSNGGRAETKDGYYYVTGSNLYYADKANLELWVPVCNRPDCDHKTNMNCNAILSTNTIYIREGRIWFLTDLDKYPELHPGLGEIKGTAIYSIAPDGTDPRLEYRNEAMELSFMGGGSMGHRQDSRFMLTALVTMDANGMQNLKVLLMTKNGAKIVYQKQGENLSGACMWSPFYGDDAFYLYDMGGDLLRLVGEELIPIDVAAYADNGGYLSGTLLRQLRPGDGYYDINLETGEEVKLCDPRLENSAANIMLPNCIIEHNLNGKDMDANTPREMEIFDGTQWRTVELPEELRWKQFTGTFNPVAIASDRIFFHVSRFTGSGTEYTIYQVMLGRDALTMELCGTMTSV